MAMRHILFGDVLAQSHFYFIRGIRTVGHKAKTVTHTEDVRVDSKSSLSESHTEHDVGSLATYAGKARQRVERLRHFSPIVLHQHAGHGGKMPGFTVRIAHGADILEKSLGRGLGHFMSRRKCGEQGGSNHVDALIRALGRQHRRHEQLKRRSKMQLCLDITMQRGKVSQDFPE